MRNWLGHSGVYNNMHRLALLLVFSFGAIAQQPREDPLDVAIRACYAADNAHFQEAATAREQARTLLQRVPASSPRFAGWTQQVAQLFQNGNWNADAAAILQDGLDRTGPLGVSDPAHISMLSSLANFWESNGNLLKAGGYMEQAVAALAAPPSTPAQRGVILNGIGHRYVIDGPLQAYIRLATLYQKLGRSDAVATLAAKIKALGSTDQSALAAFYEQRGQTDEAAAVYRQMAEQASNPQAKANAWQSMANLDAGQQNFSAAVAAVHEAIAAVQSSETPGIAGQTFWMRQNLARYQRSVGLVEQADQTYQELLQQSRGGPNEVQSLLAYAQYLGETQRGAQGEDLLKGYMADHPSAEPQQQVNFLYNLANLVRRTGDSKSADRYQQAAQALQPQPSPPAGQIRIAEQLQEANTAAGGNRIADAYRLAMDAIDRAAHASDGQSIVFNVPNMAITMAFHKEYAKGEQLYRRLFAMAEMWKPNTIQPLISVSGSYVSFLWNQPDRLADMPAAIEQYRRILVEANGPDSGSLAEPLRKTIEFERAHSQWAQANASARELLTLQEQLSGNSSEPYLNDLQLAARIYQGVGDYAGALPLFRKAIVVADQVATPNNDWHRSETRMDAAFALAALGEFDEAVALGEEAVAMHQTMRVPRPQLEQQLEQIRHMKLVAATSASSSGKQ